VFVDNDFVLTESAVIMGYLADVHELRDVYPDERRTRARIDELMSWFNTQFYQAAGYRLVYPQLFPHVAIGGSMDSAANRALIEHGRQETAKWFGVLENSLLGHGQDFLCGDTKTLADYLGAEHVAMTEWIGQSLGAYPRVGAWMKRCRGNGRDQVHAAHDSFLTSQHGNTFVTCP
jgi:glutathione S-transferase